MSKWKAEPLVWGKRKSKRMGHIEPVYLEAPSALIARARAVAKYKMMQIPVRFVSVSEYDPSTDGELLMFGYVRKIKDDVC